MSKKETVFTYLLRQQQITPETFAEQSGIDLPVIHAFSSEHKPVGDTLLRKIARHLHQICDTEHISDVLKQLIPEHTQHDAIQEELLYSVLDWSMPTDDAEDLPADLPMEDSVPEHPCQPDETQPPVLLYLPPCDEVIPTALQAFWERVEACCPSSEILLTDWGQYALDTMPEVLYEYLVEKLMWVTAHGGAVRILTRSMQEYPEPAHLLKRLPLYLNESITYYQLPVGMTCPACESFLTAGKQLVLLTRTIGDAEPISSLIQEPALTQYYCQWMKLMMAQRRPVTEHIRPAHIHTLCQKFCADAYPMTNLYLIAAQPTFLHMPEDLLEELLIQYGADREEQERCLEMRQLYAQLPQYCRCIQCYDADTILSGLSQDSIEEPFLSQLLQRKVVLQKEQFLRQLRYLLKDSERTGCRLFLPSFEADMHSMVPYQQRRILAVQEESFAALIEPHDIRSNLYSHELSCIGGFARYAEQILQDIPAMKKNPQWTRRFLSRCIAIAENLPEKA